MTTRRLDILSRARLLLMAAVVGVVSACLSSCAIEPPLKLADKEEGVSLELPIVITDLELIWNVDANWRENWYYGWDSEDIRLFGKIGYDEPTNFEVRTYFLGDDRYGALVSEPDEITIFSNSFSRKYRLGWHDLLLWSNIDSPDGAQTVLIDESNKNNIIASTTITRLGYPLPPSAAPARMDPRPIHNQPEIFFNCRYQGLHITDNPADYDYYDPVDKVYVKKIHTELTPVVYIYLVQVVLHNNNNRVIGVPEASAISGLSKEVSLHTGHTSEEDAYIPFGMRMKKNCDVHGESCDIIGGKLHTYGLCGMAPWVKSRGTKYTGTRDDLPNTLTVCLQYENGKSKTETFDITDQMRKNAHGGIITVHINVDDLRIPTENTGGGGFQPNVGDYEEETKEFEVTN